MIALKILTALALYAVLLHIAGKYERRYEWWRNSTRRPVK